jgi:hypothetical protein
MNNSSVDGSIVINGPRYQYSIESIIPEKIDGMFVTQIESVAFIDQSTITHLTIPSSVTSIDNVFFPPDTKVIWEDHYSFRGNEFLGILGNQPTFTIPNMISGRDITVIGDYAFANNQQLTSITIPTSILSIGNHAFYNCDGLTSIDIPFFVQEIGNNAFRNCSNLETVNMLSYQALQTIGDYAFDSCYELMEIYIPRGVSNIGECAFSNCLELTDISLPTDITLIKAYMLFYTPNLTSINIPDNVTSIGMNAFLESGIDDVSFGNSSQLNHIGHGAFESTRLRYLALPDSLETVESFAFSYCDSLYDIIGNRNIQYGSYVCVGSDMIYNRVINRNYDEHQIVEANTGNIKWNDHTYVNDVCSICNYETHTHRYTDHYVKSSIMGKLGTYQHESYCECGEYVLMPCRYRMIPLGTGVCVCGRTT